MNWRYSNKPTRTCDIIYNNVYNLEEEGIFEGDKEQASYRFRIEYTNGSR